jgi:hypothetical protein
VYHPGWKHPIWSPWFHLQIPQSVWRALYSMLENPVLKLGGSTQLQQKHMDILFCTCICACIVDVWPIRRVLTVALYGSPWTVPHVTPAVEHRWEQDKQAEA